MLKIPRIIRRNEYYDIMHDKFTAQIYIEMTVLERSIGTYTTYVEVLESSITTGNVDFFFCFFV